MNLTLFFRLITQVLFHDSLRVNDNSGNRTYTKPDYQETSFFCPRVYAKDGFNVSLQIHNGSYCESENGYRKLGKTWNKVEFGFPSENEPLMHEYSEMYGHMPYEFDDEGNDMTAEWDASTFTVVGTVGSIPIEVMEQVFEKHGGIDWEKSCEYQAK